MPTKAPNVEEEFINTLHQTIEKHLSDSSFTVTQLTRLVGMSRTNLHRKLTERTGLSASAYVRHIRVQYAKDLLLLHPDWCVCHVAYEVGFNTPSYFTRVFKEIYGVGPGAFRQDKKRDA